MNVLICYRRETKAWAQETRSFLMDFVGTVFLDTEDHRSAEEWRPKWQEALRNSGNPIRERTVLVLLGAAMVEGRSGDDICHLEIQEAYEAGARVVYLEAAIPGHDLFQKLVNAYRTTGRAGINNLEFAHSHHRRSVPASVEMFETATEEEQRLAIDQAWKAVFDGQVRVLDDATKAAKLWAETLLKDCLSKTDPLQALNSADLYASSGAARSGVASRALIGSSGTGKSHLLARWILHAMKGAGVSPYVVLVDPENAGQGTQALCSVLGIPRAADRLRELGYMSVPDVLAAFFRLLSENDQNRGLVVVIDSLERALDIEGATKLLNACHNIAHVAVWITCRRIAWRRYEAAVAIEAKPIGEVDEAAASDLLSRNGINPPEPLPSFVRRAVNLDILCFLNKQRVLRHFPETEQKLLFLYLNFAAEPFPTDCSITANDLQMYLQAIAAAQIATRSIRIKAALVEHTARATS